MQFSDPLRRIQYESGTTGPKSSQRSKNSNVVYSDLPVPAFGCRGLCKGPDDPAERAFCMNRQDILLALCTAAAGLLLLYGVPVLMRVFI